MSDRKPGVLRNLRIKRVALVDMGANFDKKTGDGAHILLHKSAGPTLSQVHVDSVGSEDEDDRETDYEKANLDADQRNSLPDSAFAAVWTDAKGKKRRKLPIHDAGHLAAARGRIDQADIPADVKAAARRKIEAATNKEKPVKKNWIAKMLGLAVEPDATKRAEAVAEIVKAFPPDDNDDDDKPVHKADDPMCKCADCMAKRTRKSADEDIAKAVETEVTKRVNAEVAKAIAGIREEEEVRTVLKSFTATSINIDEALPKYLAMKRANPEGYEMVMKTLKSQDAALAQSALYQDFGTRRGAGEGSAWAQIEAKADQLLEKSAGKELTREQAIEKVMEQNPKLVAQYRQEAQ